MKVSEHKEQVAVVNWARRNGLFIFSIPNGASRDAVTGKRSKESGELAGIPDLQIVLDGGQVVWLEMKRRVGGKVSDSQKRVHAMLRAKGHKVYLAEGAKEAVAFLAEYIQ